MRDFFPETMRLRERIFDAWRTAAGRFGFEPYDAPVVESLELLTRKAGEEIVNQIYAFKDKSGRDLALRPEMTPSLARMVASRQSALSFPLRWATIAQCFRYERTTRGRKREHYQWNLDIIGEASVAAEAEVLACAAEALKLLGLQPSDIVIRYSSRKLLAALFEQAGIPPDCHPATFLALDKRGKISDERMLEILQCGGLTDDQISRVMGLMEVSSIADITGRLPEDNPAWQEIAQFEQLIDAYGLASCVAFDISVVRGLSYYTGIVFECFDAAREFRAIFGGGRYDNLLRDVGGEPQTGVGLGFGDVVVAEVLQASHAARDPAAPTTVAVGFMSEEQRLPAIRFAADLRSHAQDVLLSLTPEKAKAFFSRSAKANARSAAYIGPDDVEQGQVRVKQLDTRDEHLMPLP